MICTCPLHTEHPILSQGWAPGTRGFYRSGALQSTENGVGDWETSLATYLRHQVRPGSETRQANIMLHQISNVSVLLFLLCYNFIMLYSIYYNNYKLYIYISYPTPPHPILSYPIHLSKCQASPTNIKQRHSTKELPLLRLPQSCQSTLYPATGPPLPPSGSSPHARHEGFIMGEDPFEASSQGRPCRRPARKRDQKE